MDNYLDYFLGYLKPTDSELIAKYALFSAIASDTPPDEVRTNVASKMEFYYNGAELLAVTRKIASLPLPEFVYA